MTRPRLIPGPSGAYWVRAATKRAEPVLGEPWSAELLVATLAYFRQALGFRLHAFAVLPRAFEAVVQPEPAAASWCEFTHGGNGEGPATISKIMTDVKGSFAYWHNRRHGRRGPVWEKRFKDRLLLSTEEIRAAVLKVHSRPLALGLTETPEGFPYSGLTAGRNPIRLIDPLPVKLGDMPVAVRMPPLEARTGRLRRAG